MAVRNIRYETDAILRKKSKLVDVEKDREKTLSLIDDMFETMRKYNGIGLAAVQVGVLKRIVVMEFEENKYVMINPEIILQEGEQICEEGCLSFPELFYEVKRPEHVIVKYIDENFNEATLDAHGLLAVVISHETDHLDGTLFIDKKIEK